MRVALSIIIFFYFSLTAFAQSFITTWQTDNPGTSGDNEITIPTFGGGYNYNITWVEVGVPANTGTVAGLTGNHTITLPSVGIYEIEISGTFPRIYFNNIGDKDKILSIEQWGAIAWVSMESAFRGCTNLTSNASDAPDLSSVTSLSQMFWRASLFNGAISNWDVSTIKTLNSMFREATSFNQDISSWDVSSVTDMDLMFTNANSFTSDLSSWDVSNVISMIAMFSRAYFFTSDLSSWNVSNVTNMQNMFREAFSFTSDLSIWNVSSVTNMELMFFDARSFNSDLSSWQVSSVTTMNSMFQEANSFNSDLSSWDVSNVTNMNRMFDRAASFTSDLSSWDVGNVTNMHAMFAVTFLGTSSFTSDLSSWDVSKVTTMELMFTRVTSFTSNLSSWDVSSVTNMTSMFFNSGMSTVHYDATLIGWDALPSVQSGVTLGAAGVTYCTGEAARNNLIATNGWTITDGGLNCPPLPEIALFVGADNTGMEIMNAQPMIIDFGSAPEGDNIHLEFAIENQGTADLSISGITISGSAFMPTGLIPTIVASGTTEAFTISLFDSPLGTYEETVTILSDDADESSFTFDVAGFIEGIIVIDGEDNTGIVILDNEEIDLGSTVVNTNLDKIFVIDNTTSNLLTINSITSDNPLFEILNPPTSVAPFSFEQFTVRLLANRVGIEDGTLTVSTDLNDFTFTVTGEVLEGIQGDLAIYNVVTPNGDGVHDFFKIGNITGFPDNQVIIYNRWGDKVFELKGYNNADAVFNGVSNVGSNTKLGTDNYYYAIDKGDGSDKQTGFLFLR